MKLFKLIFAFSLLFSFYVSYSQDIKVKKGEILLDKKPVARIEKVNKKYQFSDLSGNVMFTANVTSETPQGYPTPETWLEITDNKGNVHEVEKPKNTKFTLSFERHTIDVVLNSGLGILTTDGINTEKLNDIFASPQKTFSEKWSTIYEKEKEQMSKDEQLLVDKKISITSKEIIKDGKKIGILVVKEKKDASTNSMNFLFGDVEGKKVAEASYDILSSFKTSDFCTIKTFDNKELKLYMSLMKQDEVARCIFARLYGQGYTFTQDMFQAYINKKNEEYIAKEQEAKSKSLNIYDAPATVIDEDGKEHKGTITIEFESIDEILGRGKGMADITSYGNSAAFKKEGEKQKYYKAKDGIKICIENRCLLGSKSEEDGAFGHGGSQLNVISGASQFFDVLYENNKNYVLEHCKYPGEYYIKLGKKNAVYLGDRASLLGKKSSDKIKKIFDKYVECNDLDFSKYDIKSKESMIQIIDDYLKNCK